MRNILKRPVICDKYRERANESSRDDRIGEVEGADVILVDDLVDTAGTLCKAADALLAKEPKVYGLYARILFYQVKLMKPLKDQSAGTDRYDTIPLKQKSPKIGYCLLQSCLRERSEIHMNPVYISMFVE